MFKKSLYWCFLAVMSLAGCDEEDDPLTMPCTPQKTICTEDAVYECSQEKTWEPIEYCHIGCDGNACRAIKPNRMRPEFLTAPDQGKACLRHADCTQICDSILDWKCSTKCTDSSQCEDGYFCRTDGRCAIDTFEFVMEMPADDLEIVIPYPIDMAQDSCEFSIDWGDLSGIETQNTDGSGSSYCDSHTISHTYKAPGSYHIRMKGKLFEYDPVNDKNMFPLYELARKNGKRFREIVTWGPVMPSSHCFSDTEQTIKLPENDIPNLHDVTDLSSLFSRAATPSPEISKWDVSNITDMNSMFYGAKSFNADLSRWDVSNVTDMSFMFQQARPFNSDLSQWDTSKVTNMDNMFRLATSFNADISTWNTSSVTTMVAMFSKAEAFNVDISKWDVSKVTTMHSMFKETKAFNVDISGWDVSSLGNTSYMFQGAVAFDQDLSAWNIDKKYDTTDMFKDSGLSEENYCKMVKNNPFFKAWQNRLGIYYACD